MKVSKDFEDKKTGDMNDSGHGKVQWLLAFIIFLLLTILISVLLLIQVRKRRAAEEAYRLLQEQYDASLAEMSANEQPAETGLNPEELERLMNEGSEDESEKQLPEAPDKDLDWDELRELNPDIYAWISVPGLGIEYPILRKENDNAYYLNHNIDGSYGLPGVIYTENYNSADFTDPNTVIYGHNMDDETMFSPLIDLMDKDKFSETLFIYIYRENEEPLIYEIFAAYEYPSIHLLLNYDFSNEYVYDQYLKDIKNIEIKGYGSANVKKDVETDRRVRIVTLSTCTKTHDATKRYLVTGVLLNDLV